MCIRDSGYVDAFGRIAALQQIFMWCDVGSTFLMYQDVVGTDLSLIHIFSHFIQVLNLAVIRSEVRIAHKEYYGLDTSNNNAVSYTHLYVICAGRVIRSIIFPEKGFTDT